MSSCADLVVAGEDVGNMFILIPADTVFWNSWEYLSSVFFGGVGPIHWETYLREAYASLRGVKGSLRGGVLFGVAYAGGYARTILSENLQKSALRQLWLTRRRT